MSRFWWIPGFLLWAAPRHGLRGVWVEGLGEDYVVLSSSGRRAARYLHYVLLASAHLRGLESSLVHVGYVGDRLALALCLRTGGEPASYLCAGDEVGLERILERTLAMRVLVPHWVGRPRYLERRYGEPERTSRGLLYSHY